MKFASARLDSERAARGFGHEVAGCAGFAEPLLAASALPSFLGDRRAVRLDPAAPFLGEVQRAVRAQLGDSAGGGEWRVTRRGGGADDEPRLAPPHLGAARYRALAKLLVGIMDGGKENEARRPDTNQNNH